MRRIFLILLSVFLLGLSAPSAQAQSTLLADRVEVRPGPVLVASGEVEVFFGDTRLRARSITYDGASDQLRIEGPIRLTTDGGSTIFFADQAALSTDLRNGILTSARLVLNEHLQIAATEINRVEGRYTQAYQTVASTCRVCEGRAPLWRIRAKRIIHDTDEKQLYFHNARFEVMGLPVLWLPRLRMPDPTLKRATGFLQPEFRSSEKLGFGVKIPYFITLGPHKDLTVTPYFTNNNSRTLELRYRQAFKTGRIRFNGAVTKDQERPNETRGYLFGGGDFTLPRGYQLSFDIETTTDSDYLLDYGYSSKDRLDSAVSLLRVQQDRLFEADLIHYNSIRSEDDNRTQPTLVGDLRYSKVYTPARLGGRAVFGFELHSHHRNSTDPFDGPDADTIVDGRDIGRLRLSWDWQRDWVTKGGLVWETGLLLAADYTQVNDDPNFPDHISRITPQTSVGLRWPLQKVTAQATHILEPRVQLVWSEDSGDATPNDESTLLELDEGNLFAPSRFSGTDQIERGLRANLGFSWTRVANSGWESNLTLGRVVREKDLAQFAGYPGLEGANSDWLLAGQLRLPGRFSVTNRALFDDSFNVSKNELRFAYAAPRYNLGGSYIWLPASPEEDRTQQISEVQFNLGWQINDFWSTSYGTRYDLQTDRAASSVMSFGYRNECIQVGAFVTRTFASATATEPDIGYGFTVELVGFGASDTPAPRRRACAKGLKG